MRAKQLIYLIEVFHLDLVVISNRNARWIAETLLSGNGFEIVDIQYKVFPDGEHYVRISDPAKVEGQTAIVLSSMYPRQNDSFIETLMLADAARRAGAKRVIGIITYMAYARQDKLFLPGEPVTGKIVVNALDYYFDHIFVIDIHSIKLINSKKFTNLLFFDLLVDRIIKDWRVSNPLILSPDKGALHRAKFAAEKHGLDYDYLVKHRDRITGEVSVMPKELSVKGRDVIIVDDIASTGGTLVLAARKVLEAGASRVFVSVSHALLVGNALEKIKNSGIKGFYTLPTLGLKHNDPLIVYVNYGNELLETIRKWVQVKG